MKFRFWLVASTFAISAIMASHASAQARELRDLILRPTAAEAMADDYGRAISEEFARRLWEQGTPACKSARGLDQATVKRRAYEILVSYGAKLVALRATRPSEEALAAQLDELAGSGSAAELRAFSDERRLKELQNFLRAKFNDNLVDSIVNDFDHYALIHRLIRGATSPLSTGNMGLALGAADRAVAGEEAAKKAFGNDPKLQRFIDLYVNLIDAYELALIRSGSLTSPDHDIFKGIEEPLQALCLPIER
jgi:hypothetical protein